MSFAISDEKLGKKKTNLAKLFKNILLYIFALTRMEFWWGRVLFEINESMSNLLLLLNRFFLRGCFSFCGSLNGNFSCGYRVALFSSFVINLSSTL